MAGEESLSIKGQKRIALVLLFSLLLPGLSPTSTPADTMGSCTSLRSMARIYMASGSYATALPFLEKALHMARETSVPDTEACACMLDLAYLYKNQGQLKSAETMCLSGLALQQKAYDPNHPYVAHTLRILSEIYRRQAQYPQAACALERAMTIIRDVGRADDLELAPFKVDMARLLVAQGKFAFAESYFKEAIETIEANYGAEHFYTAKVLASMAELYVLQERYTDAETSIARALPIQERVFGPHHHLLVPLWLIASRIHQAKGDLDSTKTFLHKSLEAIENHTVSEYLIESDVWIRWGEFYISSKEYHKAEDAFQKALHILQSAESAHGDRMATALNNLAKIRIEQGRFSQARPLCRKALNILEGVHEQNHPRMADVLETLVQLHLQTGNTAEATKLQQRIEEIRLQQRVDYAPVATAME